MKIVMSTEWMPLVNPGLYGTALGYIADDIQEEYYNEYKNIVADFTAKKIEDLTECLCCNAVMRSPKFYNYSNDSVEFDIFIPDEILKEMHNIPADAYEFFLNEFGSHPGFISMMPYTKEKFKIAINDLGDHY